MDRISKESLDEYLKSHKPKGFEGILESTTEQNMRESLSSTNHKRYFVIHPNQPSSELYIEWSAKVNTKENTLIDVRPSFLIVGCGDGSLLLTSPTITYRAQDNSLKIELHGEGTSLSYKQLIISFVDPVMHAQQKDELVKVNVCIRAIDSDVYLLK